MATSAALACAADPSGRDFSEPVPVARRIVTRPDRVLMGIGLIIASTFVFSIGDVAAKLMTATLPAIEVTWFRYVVFALLIIPITVGQNGSRALATSRPGLQLLRALGVIASSVFFIFGLQYLQPAEATAINFISPLFVTALAIPLLGEKVGRHRWAAALVGFAGVLLVVRPGTDAFQMAALFPIATALAWAGVTIATRMMSSERPEVTMAWSGIVGAIGLSVAVVFCWRTPDLNEIMLGAVTGIFSTAGHWLVVKAFRVAPASVLAPFSYTQLVFAGVLGYWTFGVIPGPWTVAGVLVIAASGVYTAHRESRGAST